MSETYTPLPMGKYVKYVLQCPHCSNGGPHYPSGSALNEKGEKVRRWKCYNTKCDKYFIAEPLPPNPYPDVA